MNKKLLILDLDETLIFASEVNLTQPLDFIAGHYLVYKRPHLDKFLDFCFEHFIVAVWTSSTEAYAKCVVENIFLPSHQLDFVWSRSRCVSRFNPESYDHDYIKDLKKVKRRGYSLESIIMVDNTPEKIRRNYGNLIRVSEFVGDIGDRELIDLISYLKFLSESENIREIEKRGWQSKYREISN